MKTVEFMDLEFEKDDGRKVLNFLQMIGKAKHEPRYAKHKSYMHANFINFSLLFKTTSDRI